MRFDTHLCLVSAQATPNLVPVLDPDFKPKKVVLVVSDDMRMQSEWLSAVLKTKGINVEQLSIGNAYDLFGIEEKLLNWLSEHDSDNIALNVTGGTKIMAIAGQEVFRSNNKSVFYVNAETDEVLFVGDKSSRLKLSPKFNLKDYLAVHGYQLESHIRPETPRPLSDLTDRLIEEVEDFGIALGKLNYLAAEAKHSLSSPILTKQDLDILGKLLDYLELAKLLTVKDNKLVFSDEATRTFVNGGWLEFHIYRTLAAVSGELGITGHCTGAKVFYPDGKTNNEIDAAFLHTNRLHIIECKTANLMGRENQSKATDAIYKLETLLKLGGLRTRGMLVDYRGGLSPADKKRAEQSKIKLVSGKELMALKTHIKNWVSDAH